MARRTKASIEKKYKIEFVDRILDPVHGFIDVTQVEKEIIELPIFKRMQSMKQLSLTNWVFPGAEHTRYMHSLGVMHIVDLMAINLKDENYNLKYNDAQRQLLRLAGLLHDLVQLVEQRICNPYVTCSIQVIGFATTQMTGTSAA